MATLLVVPGSHPSMAARLMLERKGIPYRRVDLIPALHRVIVRAAGFEHGTVPALRIGDRRVQGSRGISRALDALVPDPPLFPSGAAERAAVQEAERWGDEVLQPVPRRLAWWALRRRREALRSFAQGARLHVPVGPAVRLSAPVAWAAGRLNGVGDAAVAADLAALPGLLDQVDAWIAAGVLGGAQPNAADYQIAASVRLLDCFDDLREIVGARPAGALARALVPDLPGRVPPVLPPAWLPAAGAGDRAPAGQVRRR